jgi:hypothetical protein
MKSETVSPLTPTQQMIARLAESMVANNPDAAEELARQLAHQAREAKRVRVLGIGLRFNAVTGCLEIRTG